MAQVTNELMYELIKRTHQEVAELRQGVSEVKTESNVIRGHLFAAQSDIRNVYAILGRHDGRLDRMEKRLDRKLAEAQQDFDRNS